MTHTITIPNWHPARLNDLVRLHWADRNRLKRSDADVVRAYAGEMCREAAVPLAIGKRRVTLALTLAPRQRAGDPDCYWKSLLDALVHARLLKDDNRQWCEVAPVQFERGKEKSTTIILEDIE